MKSRLEALRFRAIGTLGYLLTRALFSTVRFELEDAHHLRRLRERSRKVIFVLWHDQLLPLAVAHRDEGIVALVSAHADGEYLRGVLRRHGFGTVRGSSTRGGARALRKLVRSAEAGRDLAVTPDGPRGPRHRIKEGVLLAAQLTGLPLLPLAGAASSGWRFSSWDRFLVPRPFSEVRIVYGPPVRVPRDAERSERRRIGRGLEATLRALTRRAKRDPAAGPDPSARRDGAARTPRRERVR